MNKASEAFRTIGEVADELEVPKHVLRFWEGKFPHIRPMKRGGGRRYYRPEDMELLRGIRHLLHAEGYTIKGVQKILREQGIDSVKAAAAASLAASAAARKSGKGRARGDSAAAVQKSTGQVAREPLVDSRTVETASVVGKATDVKARDVKTDDIKANDVKSVGAPATDQQSVREIVQAAIRDLEQCRKLLMAAAANAPAQNAPTGNKALRA